MYNLYENGELSIKDCNFQDQMTDLLKGTLEHAEGLVKTVDLITLQEWICSLVSLAGGPTYGQPWFWALAHTLCLVESVY